MSQVSASRVDLDQSTSVTVGCPNQVSWSSNLLNGLLSVVLHPFVPLMNCGFDYSCLFSKLNHCCTRSPRCNQSSAQPSNQQAIAANRPLSSERVLDYMRQWADNLNILGINGQHTGSRSGDHGKQVLRANHLGPRTLKSPFKYRCLNIAQLIILNIVLSYLLVKDIREILRCVKSRLARENHNDQS